MNDPSDATVVFVADLRAGTGAAACLRRGWADPEPHGTWTLGRESRFAIDWSPWWRDATLVVSVTPHRFPGLAAARLALNANGIPLGAFSVSDPAAITCPIAPWMIGADQTVEIALAHPDAAQPSVVSGSADARELGFLVERIAVRCRTAAAAAPARPDDAAVLRRFASLGDSCEFGLVRRRCGITERSLFDFADAPIATLIAGLDSRFEGLDDSDSVAVMLVPRHWATGPRRYLVYHIDYEAAWRADAFEGEQPAERVLADERRKLGALRDDMLEALAAARRIHVVRRTRPLALDEVLPLWHALRRHGPNALLWVVPADDTHRPGTVVPVEPGLYQGFIDHLAPVDDPNDVSARGWIELCRRTLALHETR